MASISNQELWIYADVQAGKTTLRARSVGAPGTVRRRQENYNSSATLIAQYFGLGRRIRVFSLHSNSPGQRRSLSFHLNRKFRQSASQLGSPK